MKNSLKPYIYLLVAIIVLYIGINMFNTKEGNKKKNGDYCENKNDCQTDYCAEEEDGYYTDRQGRQITRYAKRCRNKKSK
jgi:hypothetical protein